MTHRPRLLLLSMYPLDQGSWGATTRIRNMRDALASMVDLDVVSGYRPGRRAALIRYALSGRLRSLDGIYVENSTTLPAEMDIAFLALARSLGIPVLTYIRDAQQLFAEYYAADNLRRRASRALFLPAMRALGAVSTRIAFPSAGLAGAVLRDPSRAALLPPGARPPVEIPASPDANQLLFVGGLNYPVQGADLLFVAVEIARGRGHPVELTCVSRPHEEPPRPHPTWLHIRRGGPDEIERLLPGVIASVTPRRRSPYNDLAVPIKVLEYLSYGRPLLVTDCEETAAIVRSAECGIVVRDTADELADGIAAVFEASVDRREQWGAAARAAARVNSWEHRARQVLTELGLAA